MKKKIIITATFAACLALCAAVWPQAETVKETPLPSEMTAVTALQPTLQNTEEWVVPVTTEKEKAEVEPTPEGTVEELPVPATETEKQPEAEQEPMPPTKPEPDSALVPPTQPKYEPIPEMEPEASNNSSEDKVYVPGFGWIESQGPNHVEYAEDMYENGNKIGSMG